MQIRHRIQSVLVAVFATTAFGVQGAAAQIIYEEVPGQREFTGEMLIRPVQIQGWMERGLTRKTD